MTKKTNEAVVGGSCQPALLLANPGFEGFIELYK
jgi:hypothetical protein